MVAEKSGTYYGKAMHTGSAYAVARSAGGDVFLNNCPAIHSLFLAKEITVQPRTGNLLIADWQAGRIRSVSR